MTTKTSFWGEDLSVLLKPEYLADFIPLPEQDEIQRLNSLSRFFLYLGAMVGIHRKSVYFFLIVAFVPMISLYLYYYKKYYLFEEGEGEMVVKEEFKDIVMSEYRESTVNNPFMNYNYTDIASGVASKKSNSYKKAEVKKKVETNFQNQNDLYKDTDDVYADRQSRVNFYTVPGTYPEDSDGTFRNWIYKELQKETCKEKHGNCKPYFRDLKQQKRE